MKKLFSILIIISIIFTLTACQNKADTDKIVIAVPQDPDSLDPHKAAASGTEEIMFNVFEGLLKPNSKGNLVKAIAESFDISEDGLVYTFTIKDNVKFHNGQTVSIEDVEYSYKRLRGDFTDKPLNSNLAKADIKVVNNNTIEFTLKEINTSFIGSLTEAVIPANMSDAEHGSKPVGTGPYKFIEYVPSQKIVLTKFDDYRVTNIPAIKNVEFRIFADDQTALMSLQSGAVDIYPRINSENLDLIPDNYTYVEGAQNLVQIMAMNNKVKPFNSVKVRKAINYAVDVDAIINSVANGKGIKLGSNMSPAMQLYYEQGLENKYNLNIEKAKQLLKEAGYEHGFKTTLVVPSNYQFHVDTAQVIASQLGKVGIEVEIKKVEWNNWLQEVYSNRNYEMTIIAFTGKLDPHPVLNRYASDYSKNFINFANDRYDALMKQAVTTKDPLQRAEIYKDAQRILAEEVPCVYIMDPNLLVALNKNIEGYEMYPIYVQDMSILKLKNEQ
jgi:peptide/nickel transport system substrate-binding protein